MEEPYTDVKIHSPAWSFICRGEKRRGRLPMPVKVLIVDDEAVDVYKRQVIRSLTMSGCGIWEMRWMAPGRSDIKRPRSTEGLPARPPRS